MKSSITAVVLAAGKGTRMKSARAKVLHEVFFRPMVHHVLDAVEGAGIDSCAVIVGHQRREVLDTLAGYAVVPVIQERQEGTGHAVLCAEEACRHAGLVMILCGDTPLIRPETLRAMLAAHAGSGATLTLMTTALEEPFGYGRVLRDTEGGIIAIVEEKDASEEQRRIREINAGIYLVQRDFLFSSLRRVDRANSQGEVYLTDIVSLAAGEGLRVEGFSHSPAIDVLGVNSRVELAQAHAELQARRNRDLMSAGVTLYQPGSTLVAPDCEIGRDTVLNGNTRVSGASRLGENCLLEEGCVLHGCRIGDGARIGAGSVLERCEIPPGASVPPLTRLLGT